MLPLRTRFRWPLNPLTNSNLSWRGRDGPDFAACSNRLERVSWLKVPIQLILCAIMFRNGANAMQIDIGEILVPGLALMVIISGTFILSLRHLYSLGCKL